MIDLSNDFILRTLYFFFCLVFEDQTYQRDIPPGWAWVEPVGRLAGLVTIITILITLDPTIQTFDDFYRVLIGPAVVCLGITGFGYRLRNQRRKRLEVEQLKQQYQPLSERTSDYNG